MACRDPTGSRVGKDATEDFEDVGHSDEARKLMSEQSSGIKIVGTVVVSGNTVHRSEYARS